MVHDYYRNVPIQYSDVFFETTDRRKATKALHHKGGLIYSSPNLLELRAMAKFLSPNISIAKTTDLDEVLALSKIVLNVIDFIIVTIGAKGIVTIRNIDQAVNKGNNILVAKYYPLKAIVQVENVSGAGDCFASGFIYGMLLGHKESHNVFVGFESAKKALSCSSTVPKDFNITCALIDSNINNSPLNTFMSMSAPK